MLVNILRKYQTKITIPNKLWPSPYFLFFQWYKPEKIVPSVSNVSSEKNSVVCRKVSEQNRIKT